MRPLKITMTAFGPYKNREVIDFTELKNNRLFVVSGNTGAGKTTIFDAICFALYGSASGEDRSETKFMRSDFADDDVHTSVELEFELHGRHYRIMRQLPHVKAGNKSATGEQYEFFEKVGGKEIPCVDRQIVSEINKKVESIIGLTKDQFSQIVMLPQGEFRKLLTSQTENKEEILRKIFKTEPYLWISDRLKDRKKSAEEEFKREAQTRDRFITDIMATVPEREMSILFEVLSQLNYNTNQVLAGLDEEAAFYQSEIEKNRTESELAEAAYHQKLGEFHQAKALNERFQDLENKEMKLQEMSGQVPLFKIKEQQLEKAERASKIEAYEQQVNEWRHAEKVKQQGIAKAEFEKTKALELRENAQALFEAEENKKSEREETTLKLNRYNEFLPTVMEIDLKKAELVAIHGDVQKLKANLDGVQDQLLAKKAEKEQLSDAIKSMGRSVEQLPVKTQKLQEMRDQVRILKEYLAYEKKQVELEQDLSAKLKDYQAMKGQYQRLEEAWISGQASILAAHLHDGKPCPVCGSAEHPNKADGHETIPTKAELEKVKKDLDQKDGQYRSVEAALNSNKEILGRWASEVTEIGVATETAGAVFTQLAADGKILRQEVEALEAEQKRLTSMREQLEETESGLNQLEAQRETISNAFQERKTAFETNKAVYQTQLAPIPEEIRSLAVLEQKIRETQVQKLKLEKDLETAVQRLQQAKDAETAANAYYSSALAQLDETKQKLVQSEMKFTQELNNALFTSEEDYLNAKLSEASRQQLKETINEFNQNLNSLKQQIEELRGELKDLIKADLYTLNAEALNLKAAYEKGAEALRQAEQTYQNIGVLKKKIIDSEKKAAELEKQMNIITDLHDVIRGQNSRRISFERYLQIEYLEEIIVAANERLKHLSNGQFLLIRSERQESRGKQSGLGLDVFDAYTGQTRDVKTLSGGEKFNASLCLALGMADVIQSFQGGVSIDTMFIDEGFGSLDEESLNKAIDTLVDLQKSGRMIGVISHVQELKSAMPAILEVKKTKEGYSQTEFVIK